MKSRLVNGCYLRFKRVGICSDSLFNLEEFLGYQRIINSVGVLGREKLMKIKKEHVLVFIAVISSILIPLILYFIIPIWNGGIANDETWLLFWATWLGAIVGGIITILGVYITLNQNKKQYVKKLEDDQTLFDNKLKVEREQFALKLENDRKRYEDDRRLSLMPHLKFSKVNRPNDFEANLITIIGTTTGGQVYKNINASYFTLKNIGIGSAIDISIEIEGNEGYVGGTREKWIYNLGVNESILIKFDIHVKKAEKLIIKVKYEDVLKEYRYIQKGEIILNNVRSSFDIIVMNTKKESKL